MMLLGHYIAHREDAIKQQDMKKLVLVAVGSLLLMFVTVNVKILNLDISQVFKVSTATLIFILCIMKPDVGKPKFMIVVGRKYSSMIYLSHFMVGLLIKDAMIGMGIASPVIAWTQPFLAIVRSVIFAVTHNI